MSQKYVVYGGQLSYFSRKLEAALTFYDADFEMRPKTPDISQEVESRSGTHQVPVLQTPENWMIGDTTPLLHLLDGRFSSRRLFPAGAAGVMTQIIEDYFDEWIARTVVHYRWHYEESALFASEKMSNGFPEVAERMRGWGPRACRATGTDSEQQRQAAEDEYHRMMQAAETQLAQTAYLLGDRPTAVDCVVLGGLRAHTLMDPTPKAQMARYERVIEWATRTADQWDGEGELAAFPESTAFARFVLTEMKATYVPFVLGNRKALEAGAKAFHADIYGEEVSYLCRPYPEKSRVMIKAEINQLSEDERARVSEWLTANELDSCFLD